MQAYTQHVVVQSGSKANTERDAGAYSISVAFLWPTLATTAYPAQVLPVQQSATQALSVAGYDATVT